MNEVPTKRAMAAAPKAREKRAWAVQPWQERGLLSPVTLQQRGACGRGEADLQEGQAAAEKVPRGGQSSHTVDIMRGADWLESSAAEKGLGVPEDDKLSRSQQCTIVAKAISHLPWPRGSSHRRVLLQSSGHSHQSPGPSEGHSSSWGAERQFSLPISPGLVLALSA